MENDIKNSERNITGSRAEQSFYKESRIGDVIRKYRKSKDITQEEMANRLGVTAPAVNKWERGVSQPDISLLAPIARLLDITLETLLSFDADLTCDEINAIIKDIDSRFKTESYDSIFKYAQELAGRYPNCYQLMWQLAIVLDARQILNLRSNRLQYGVQDEQKCSFENEERENKKCGSRNKLAECGNSKQHYEDQIVRWYELALEHGDPAVSRSAAGSLFEFYMRNEEYAKAEQYIGRLPEESPETKRKLGMLYSRTGKTADAYKTYEEILFSGFSLLSAVMHSLYMLCMDDNDIKGAEMWIEKESLLASLFDMGEYRQEFGRLELAASKKDVALTLLSAKKLLASTPQLGDFSGSAMYSHMKFKKVEENFYGQLNEAILENFRDRETFGYMDGNKEWEELIKK